jgi:hypothetical protein
VANKRLPKSVESGRRPSNERPLTEGAAKFMNAVSGRNAGADAKRCEAVAATQGNGNQAPDFHHEVVPAALVADRRHA